MAAQTSVPYDWLRHIPHSVLEKDEIPILSSPGPFPLDKLTAFLTKTFQLDKLEIEMSQWETFSPEVISKGLGGTPRYLNIELSPVAGMITWAMSEKDIKTLVPIIFAKEARAGDTIDKDYLEGFFEFIALETLLSFNRSEYDKGLSPHLLESIDPPKDAVLYSDIAVNCSGFSFVARLFLSDEFRHSWKDRYTQHKMRINMSSELAEKIQVVVHLEGGKTTLTRKEWASIHNGDYMLLDSCSLQPGAEKSRIMITLNGQPLFRAKVKQGNLKILEFPLYQEVETTMSKENDDEDEDTDEYFDESELETDIDEFHEDEESELETDDHSIGDMQTPAPIKKGPPEVAENSLKATAPAQSSPTALDNIQMTVVVEVGRLQMSIQKLMELQPGNLIELDIHPENGVDLVVNGKCIGRGELLRIGDTLGVRILDKG